MLLTYLLCVSINAPGQGDYTRSEVTINLPKIWSKLIELVDEEEWERVSYINEKVKDVLVVNCWEQLELYNEYLLNIGLKKKLKAKNQIVIIIANSILLEINSVLDIEDVNLRKAKVKDLFGELISIQFFFKKVDFNYYKSLYSLIKSMYGNISNTKKMEEIINSNLYYKSLLDSCRN